MATIISKTTIQASVGTQLDVRVTVLDKATRAAKDLSTYACSFALKASPDETSTYLAGPTAGTTDSSGHLDATVSASSMEAAAIIAAAQAGGTVTGEMVATLSGVEKIRVQMPVQIKPRVIV